jgi:hypothetical protein
VPLAVYSVLRLALVAVCWALLAWAGLHPLVALAVAALLAWGLSYVLLGRFRDGAAAYLADRAARRREGRPTSRLDARLRDDAVAEDAAVDAAESGASSSSDEPASDEPVSDEPASDEPVSDEPAPDESVPDESASDGSVPDESASSSDAPHIARPSPSSTP